MKRIGKHAQRTRQAQRALSLSTQHTLSAKKAQKKPKGALNAKARVKLEVNVKRKLSSAYIRRRKQKKKTHPTHWVYSLGETLSLQSSISFFHPHQLPKSLSQGLTDLKSQQMYCNVSYLSMQSGVFFPIIHSYFNFMYNSFLHHLLGLIAWERVILNRNTRKVLHALILGIIY